MPVATAKLSEEMDQIAENESEKNVIWVCKYILANSTGKLPIKCSEITKVCLNGESRLLPKIIGRVSDTLSDVRFTKMSFYSRDN